MGAKKKSTGIRLKSKKKKEDKSKFFSNPTEEMKVDLLHEMEFEQKQSSGNPWDKMTSILFSSKV